ncbi:hypothetical protein [Nocardioides sp. YIM 152588]|uniref:hypothetical protein n=1 Tax=Nocardioides sp. YIM 152588 TaxID=3158259 RepID=UPI0032E4DB3E
MEILLWLAPAAVVTVVTSLWVAWWGRQQRGRPVDAETAARRLGEALEREHRRRPGYAVQRRPGYVADRSSGVALRPSRTRPVLLDGEQHRSGEGGGEGGGPSEGRFAGGHGRRAS